MLFNELYPDNKIVHTLCSQFTWSHIRILITIKDELKREFYIQIFKHERWSVRILQNRINSMLYERTAISKKPEQTIENDLNALKSKERNYRKLMY